MLKLLQLWNLAAHRGEDLKSAMSGTRPIINDVDVIDNQQFEKLSGKGCNLIPEELQLLDPYRKKNKIEMKPLLDSFGA